MRTDILQYGQFAEPQIIPLSEDDSSLEESLRDYREAGWEEEPDTLINSITTFVDNHRVIAVITYVPVSGQVQPEMVVQELFVDGSVLVRRYRRVDRDDGPYTVVQVGNPVPC